MLMVLIFHSGTGELKNGAIIIACVHVDVLNSLTLKNKIHEKDENLKSHSIQITLKTSFQELLHHSPGENFFKIIVTMSYYMSHCP